VIERSGRTLWDSDQLVEKNHGKPAMSISQVQSAGPKIGSIPRQYQLPSHSRVHEKRVWISNISILINLPILMAEYAKKEINHTKASQDQPETLQFLRWKSLALRQLHLRIEEAKLSL
jgi:hypothetical protein